MASMIGQMFAGAAQQTQNPVQNIMNQLRQLQQTFKGDPATQVPIMLQRMGISDAQIQQYKAQATEIMKAMNGGL